MKYMNSSISNKPLVINWMISGRCNMSCKFCFGRFNSFQMTKKDKLFIMDQIVKYQIPKLALTGGEPLLDGDIIEILKIAHINDIFTSLHTNGLLLDKALIERIKPINNRISLPLDGSTDEMNFIMRCEPKYFSRITKIVEILKKEGISYSLKTVASKKNIDDIEKMATIMLDLRPHIWLITEFKPLRRGKDYQDEFQISKSDLETLRIKLSKIPVNFSILSNDNLSNHPHFFIDSKGDVFTNGNESDIYIGDMFSDSIPTLWKNILERNKITQTYYAHSTTI